VTARLRLGLAAAALAALASAPSGATGASEGPDRGAWLQDALAAAPAGAVIDVPPGRYAGPFAIVRPVTLRGHGRAVLVGDGATHVVEVHAADVTIAGFEVRASGTDLGLDHAGIHVTGARAVIRGNTIVDCLHGIYVRHADGVRIEDNVIRGLSQTLEPVDPPENGPKPGEGELCATPLNQNRRGNGVHVWNSAHQLIARNTIRDTRDGIYFSFVTDTDVRENDISRTRYGLHYMYSDDNRFERNRFSDNAAGAALMSSNGLTLKANRFVSNRSHRAYGLLLQTVGDSVIAGNEIAGNTVGLFIENGRGNRFVDNRIAANHVGIHVSDSTDTNTFAGNRFAGNIHPVETTGGNGSNRWAEDGRGNAWEGAAQLDLDGNGIADLPHHELDLFGDLRHTFPPIGLLAGSPGERLLRVVHGRLALPGASGITDPAPIVTGASR
jgi:nitrous oxidase accessory protein